MSSLLVCAQPVTGNSASFIPVRAPALLQRIAAANPLSRVTPASRLETRPSPDFVSTGILRLDTLAGGLPRGCLTEIYGVPSSGRTSTLLSVIAAATRRQEACALVDVSNALDPYSAIAAGINLQQLLWVRCSAKSAPFPKNRAEKARGKSDLTRMTQALKITDLLVQSGGFGLIAIDLSGLPHSSGRRIPLASWFRFRRAVENTPTVLLVVSQAPCAGTCASLLLKLEKSSVLSRPSLTGPQLSAISSLEVSNCDQKIIVHNFPNHEPFAAATTPAHAQLLKGISIRTNLERSRLDSKPPQSEKTGFEAKTRWCI